jgi:hypothetical protein
MQHVFLPWGTWGNLSPYLFMTTLKTLMSYTDPGHPAIVDYIQVEHLAAIAIPFRIHLQPHPVVIGNRGLDGIARGGVCNELDFGSGFLAWRQEMKIRTENVDEDGKLGHTTFQWKMRGQNGNFGWQ